MTKRWTIAHLAPLDSKTIDAYVTIPHQGSVSDDIRELSLMTDRALLVGIFGISNFRKTAIIISHTYVQHNSLRTILAVPEKCY